MSASKIPRYLLFATVLGTAVTVIMLSMFYGQYRWLAGEIVARSSAEHDSFIEASFERRVRFQMHTIADTLVLEADISDSSTILQVLNRSLAGDETMDGLRFTNTNSQILQSGNFPATKLAGRVTWLEDRLVITYPVVADGVTLGEVAGSFQLDELRAESRQLE